LLVLAVMNPLCCCWVYGQDAEAGTAMKADHSCCNSQSNTDSSDESQNPSGCEHEAYKESALATSSITALPDLSFTALSDLFESPQSIKYLRQSTAPSHVFVQVNTSVPRWVGIQTDCVRRL
jgi:hypothetical protein